MEIIDRISCLLGNREQKELTNYLGLNSVAFSEWKSGKSRSYRKYLIEIAEFFHVSLDYLVYGNKNNSIKLNPDEQELLENYSRLSEADKKEVSEKVKELSVYNDVFGNKRAGSQNENEMLEIFKKFNDREQIKIIGRMEEWLEVKYRRNAIDKQQIVGVQVARRTDGKFRKEPVTAEEMEKIKALPEDTDY
ncbi:MAG: helix-turn-helix domain containing protein [Ruminococcus sp.]|nr:helix-turn-helix domain containing protein [Ruminococcus sp.]